MPKIGYYKYKISDVTEGEERKVEFYINGILAKTCTVICKKFCLDYKILKYIDKNGQYRFFPFNDRWEEKDRVREIGDKDKLTTSLLNGQGSSKQMGYKVNTQISLAAHSVSMDELNKLSDIYVSPRCYLYVGDGTSDLEKDWVLVKAKGDGKRRLSDDLFTNIYLTIESQEKYAITEI